jgi:multidrug efflux system membrane fusion protein
MTPTPPATALPASPEAPAALPNHPAPLALPDGHANGKGPVPPSRPPAPAARRRSPWLWLWIALAVLVVLAAVFYLTRPKADAPGKGKGKGAHALVMPVIGATAVQGDIGVYETGLGTVTPLTTVTLQARVTGQLMKINFTEGQFVKKGDLLIEIDERPFQVALDQAQGQLLHDQALLDNAKIDLQRYQTLWAQDSIPQQTLATQQALVTQDEGTVKTDQGAVDNAKLNIAYCRVASPIDGRVGLRLVDEGNMVSANATSLLVINQITPITVVFTLAEDAVPAVMQKLNAGTKLAVDAFDRAQAHRLAEGSLLTVDNQIDPTTGTLRMKAIFANTDGQLFPNQFVNARLLVEMKHGVILVPQEAIQRGTQNATYVYVVQNPSDAKNQTVAMRQVEIGTVEGDQAEVTKGIAAGEVVVIDGVDKLQEGGKVSLQLRK